MLRGYKVAAGNTSYKKQAQAQRRTSVVLPGEMRPSCSARLIMFSAIRSLTLCETVGHSVPTVKGAEDIQKN